MARRSWESSQSPEKEITKMFVTGLKPDLFLEEIYSEFVRRQRKLWSSQGLNCLLDLVAFWISRDITDRVKKVEIKKDKKYSAYTHAVVNLGS